MNGWVGVLVVSSIGNISMNEEILFVYAIRNNNHRWVGGRMGGWATHLGED